MIRVLFQGDSITDGNRYKSEESRWDLNHQIGHSYAYVIASTLGKKHPGRYHFINRAISSDCVDRMAARFSSLYKSVLKLLSENVRIPLMPTAVT